MNAEDFLRRDDISDDTKIDLTLIQWEEMHKWMEQYAKEYHESELKKLHVDDSIKLVCECCNVNMDSDEDHFCRDCWNEK
jgi:hypothetical protein